MFAALPQHVQQQAEDAYALFKQNPHHPSLHCKPIKGRNTYYSARVGIHYCVLAYEDDGEVIWFWIGPMPSMTSWFPSSDSPATRAYCPFHLCG